MEQTAASTTNPVAQSDTDWGSSNDSDSTRASGGQGSGAGSGAVQGAGGDALVCPGSAAAATKGPSAPSEFVDYIAAGDDAGLDDTAGSRLKRTQVGIMEKSLNEAGLDGPKVLAEALADTRNQAIAEAWQIEADEEFGCPMPLTKLSNVGLIFTIIGVLVGISFYFAYESTPQLDDEALQKAAVQRFRASMAGATPEPEPEADEEVEPAATSAYVFLVLSAVLGLLSVSSMMASGGGEAEPAAAQPQTRQPWAQVEAAAKPVDRQPEQPEPRAAAPSLPQGWELRPSADYPGRSFYFEAATGKSQWEPPVAAAAPEALEVEL